MSEFYGIRYSPWSLRTLWALAYHDCGYTYKEFTPGLSDFTVRWKTKNFCGPLTVPVMVLENGKALVHGADIVKWSSLRPGPNNKGNLYNGIDEAQLEGWQAAADVIMSFTRVRYLIAVLKNDECIKAMLPDFALKLGVVGLALGRRKLKKSIQKYKFEPGARDIEAARASLQSLRQRLSESGGEYIQGHFTYADILMSIALHSVEPSRTVFPIKEVLSTAAIVPELANEFRDLLIWRDRIVQKHYFNPRTRKFDS